MVVRDDDLGAIELAEHVAGHQFTCARPDVIYNDERREPYQANRSAAGGASARDGVGLRRAPLSASSAEHLLRIHKGTLRGALFISLQVFEAKLSMKTPIETTLMAR
jgi:hypothetical protein